jgi:hypothetical protein
MRGPNVANEGTVRHWYRMFEAVHDEGQSGQPSVANDLAENVDQNSCERWHFTISELLCEFPTKVTCCFLRDYHS